MMLPAIAIDRLALLVMLTRAHAEHRLSELVGVYEVTLEDVARCGDVRRALEDVLYYVAEIARETDAATTTTGARMATPEQCDALRIRFAMLRELLGPCTTPAPSSPDDSGLHRKVTP